MDRSTLEFKIADVDRRVSAIKRRSWVDWLINGLGIFGLVAAIMAFNGRASHADVQGLDDKVRAVEAVQGVHTEAIGEIRQSQFELKQALQRVEDKLDVLIAR